MLEPQGPQRPRQAPRAPRAPGDAAAARDGVRREPRGGRAAAPEVRARRRLPRPVACLEKDWDALTAFFDFPKEHWKHLRTSNIVESPFASLRLRTNAAKRSKVLTNATVLIWKVLRVAGSRWRKLDAPELLKDVYDGRRFVDGKPVTRAIGREAA